MHENMRNLLNAYLDGELHGPRLLELKRHLATCEPCQEELEELRHVSELLQAAPAPAFKPAERFAADLAMRLPRRDVQTQPFRSASLAWWLVPAGLMAAWYFIQTLFALTDVATAAQWSGMLGQATTWLGGQDTTVWFTATVGLFGSHAVGAQPGLTVLNTLNVLAVNLLEGFVWQALIAFLYGGWLLAWWVRRRPMEMKLENS